MAKTFTQYLKKNFTGRELGLTSGSKDLIKRVRKA